MASLPTPGGDQGTWGTILNGFLEVSHNSNGTLKTAALRNAGGITTSQVGAASGVASLNGDTLVPTAQLGVGTASSSTYLRGDGTWMAPSGGSSSLASDSDVAMTSPSNNQVLTYNSTANKWVNAGAQTPANATNSTPGLMQLSGDLGNSATSPEVMSTHLSSPLPVTQGGTGSSNQNFVSLAGDLGNSVATPRVESIQGVAISGTPSANQVLTASSSSAASWSALASAPISSVFGRTGAVVAQTGDYTAAEVGAGGLGTANTWTGKNVYTSGEPWFDIDAFGADPTGVADSTVAFNECIAACLGGSYYTTLGYTASSTTVTNPNAQASDLNQYINSTNFSPAYSKILAVTPDVGYTVQTAATATLSSQSAFVGYAWPIAGKTAIGKMRLGAGTYRVSSDIIIRSTLNFRLEGAGFWQTRIAPVGTNFTQAVLFIDGSEGGVFEGFNIQGNGTEGSGGSTNPGLPDVIRLDWTTAAQRSTSGNTFRDIYIANTNFVTGFSLEGNGSVQVDGTQLYNVLINGQQTVGSWLNTGNWQKGIAFGNGTFGNNYDHVGIYAGGSRCYYGYYINASSFGLFGAQLGSNYCDFYINPGAQCTVENYQSQSSGMFLQSPNATSVNENVSFRDVYFNGYSGGQTNYTWVSIGENSNNWLFENVYYHATNTSGGVSVMSFGAGHGAVGGTYTLINVSQGNPPSAGIVTGTNVSLVAVGYKDTTALIEDTGFAVPYAFYAVNAGVLYSQGTSSSRPSATTNGEGFYWATDTNTLSHSNGATWTNFSITPTAPDVQWFTTPGSYTWTMPTSPSPVTTEVYLLAGGGGGGSGSRLASGAQGGGGGGGAGGGLLYRKFVSTDLPSSVTGTVGSGGTGGVAVATDTTAGNVGTNGTGTTFGVYAAAEGAGQHGAGGTLAGAGGALGSGGVGTAPGGNSGAGGSGVAGTASQGAAGGAGGGGGGGISTAPAAFIGGAAAYSYEGSTSNTGVAGAIDGALPTAGTQPTVKGTPSCGGAGGSSSITTAAQAGASAFFGGGGGGGGASLNGNNSGAGGNGGPGFALIISYFQ